MGLLVRAQHVCTYAYIHTYVCMYVCIYIRMYVCIYIHKYFTHSYKHIHKHTRASDHLGRWPHGGVLKKMKKIKKPWPLATPEAFLKWAPHFQAPSVSLDFPALREKGKRNIMKKRCMYVHFEIYTGIHIGKHTHTRTHTPAHTHTRTHTHTHKHQHINVGIYTGPQWWRYRGQDATLVPSRSVCLPPLTPLVRV